MSRVNGDMRNANSAMETLNAAVNAIALAEARATPVTSQKKKWRGCLSAYWCFKSQKPHNKRISHAILVPEPSSTVIESAPSHNLVLPNPIGAHFAAPPSSPASFVPSDPPSAAQSPPGLLSFTSISHHIHSPGGPRSIFAIGPYAHETQLVSPPTFSTYTTEPSTAPFTPPPESVHMTTPSSPEVPFAQFLNQRLMQSQFDYLPYKYYVGSSPAGSVFSGSGTSSPLLDPELFSNGLYYPDTRYDWGSSWRSDDFALNHQNQNTTDSLPDEYDDQEPVQRVSFEDLPEEDVVRCVEKEPALPKAPSVEDATEKPVLDAPEKPVCQRQRSASLGSIKEFNFDNVNRGEPHKPCLGPNWWTNDKVTGKEPETSSKNWSFYPAP